MKKVTMVRFMTKEELVDMMIQLRNFVNPNTRKRHHRCRTAEECWADPWNRARYGFNMNNLDYVDALILPDGGYVRYYGAADDVLDMLKIKFGFEEESI